MMMMKAPTSIRIPGRPCRPQSRPGRSALHTLAVTLVSTLLFCAVSAPVTAHDAGTGGAAGTGKSGGSSYGGPYHAGSGGVPPMIAELRKAIDPKEAVDEALGGKTIRGTPVYPRTAECFPAEQRDVFWQMDWVADATTGVLKPLDYDVNQDGKVDDKERNAIRGRNTWLLWGGGNETFWGWLQEQGYGITDFLVLMDSRQRNNRFKSAGMINQPGFRGARPDERILGLYIDRPDGDKSLLRPKTYNAENEETTDAQGRPVDPPVGLPKPPSSHRGTDLFKPGDPDLYYKVQAMMPRDGLDYTVYGYPSGIFGLRLMLNPDFFGDTAEAARARTYWKDRVESSTHSSFYTDPKINKDRNLIRPFRVSMSCGFCHVAPHPLNPPADVENPKWENLSSVIGGQYWEAQPVTANLLPRNNFLHHFLASQPPGTIDTSLVSTDQLNNTNIINAVFDLPSRIARAKVKPPEKQSPTNLLMQSLEDGEPARYTLDPPPAGKDMRHFPMVLFPGEDSCGVFAALARVPLNIGVFSEQWARCDNPVIGFTKQRPFEIATNRTNSVYWNVNEKYRVGYMADFFLLGISGTVPKSTAPMKLKDAGPQWMPGGAATLDGAGKAVTEGRSHLSTDAGLLAKGRRVFLNNCSICHSSKQPDGFDLRFAEDWETKPVPKLDEPAVYTLPSRYGEWEAFRASPMMADFRARMQAMAGDGPATPDAEDAFIKDNFLSNELRVPVTLVGTNSARAMATNAIRGNVWDNFSSESFKNLPSVGDIYFYNVATKTQDDRFNDGREKGGPGYYRPASLISVWSTAPYFHNNALGLYNQDPSVKGRMEAFDDGIRKLLWNEKRPLYTTYGDGKALYVPPGDLRRDGGPYKEDPGYIYRLPNDTWVEFAPTFIEPLITGVAGKFIFRLLSFWLWLVLGLLFLAGFFWGRARHAGILVILVAVLIAGVLAGTGMGGLGGTVPGALMMAASGMLEMAHWLWWLAVVAVAAVGLWLLLTNKEPRKLVKWLFALLFIGTTFTGILAHKFLNGRLRNVPLPLAVLPDSLLSGDYKGVNVGPIPRGTPVDLLMNLDPEKKNKLPAAILGLVRATVDIRKQHLTGDDAYKVFSKKALPGLVEASKCPDYVLDRGHWFGEQLKPDEKEALIEFLKTL